MGKEIKIIGEDFEAKAELLEEDAPETCEKIWENLPLEGKASLFKEEIYFTIPVDVEPEDTTPTTERGDVSYWPQGPAFCVFFGGSQPVSPVATFAKLIENIDDFRNVEEGEEIVVEKAE